MFSLAWKYWGTRTRSNSTLLTCTRAMKMKWSLLDMRSLRSTTILHTRLLVFWSANISKERALMSGKEWGRQLVFLHGLLLCSFNFLFTLLGSKSSFNACGVCEGEVEPGNAIQCYKCREFFHYDCVDVEESMLEDEFQEDWYCDECLWHTLVRTSSRLMYFLENKSLRMIVLIVLTLHACRAL